MSDIRKAFAAIASKAPRKVEIDADGAKLTVYFRHMKLPDYAAVRGLSALSVDERIAVMPEVLARFLCDENGVVLYDYTKPEEVAEVAALDLKTIGELTNAMNDVKKEAKKEETNGEAQASPN